VNNKNKLLNKRIKSINLHKKLEENFIEIRLNNNKIFTVKDNRQMCCEERYITTDDDLSYFTSTTIIDIDLSEVNSSNDDDTGHNHDIKFLRISTDKGVIVFESHNKHNGAYGGFNICIVESMGLVW
jgi:hypothetical protein